MKDIAEKIGVSRTAVSFVLNGQARQRGVSRTVERQIQNTAREMGYRPSRLAQSLIRQRTMTIGLLLPGMSETLAPPIAQSIEEQAYKKGYQVILSHHRNDAQLYQTMLNAMAGWQVDGLITVPLVAMDQLPVYQELLAIRKPVVILEREMADRSLPLVTGEATAAVQIAIHELVKAGHRRIVMLDAPRAIIESQHREYSFKRTMQEAGLSCDPGSIVAAEMGQSIDATSQLAIEHWFSGPSPAPTAVVVASAARAVSLCQHCLQAGVKVPHDLSMVVMTGYRFTDFHKLKFSTILLNYDEMGKSAFNLLMDEIDRGENSARRILVPPMWQPGESIVSPSA